MPDEWMHADWLLDAVEQWASGLQGDYWLVRETIAGVKGRIDGILVPASFACHVFKAQTGYWLDKAGLIGIEVKSSRADFLAGIKKGQYERYAESKALCGLYVATPRNVKTTEVPKGIGHLVVYRPENRRDWQCVCKRHPKYSDANLDADTMWRLIFYAIRRMQEERRDEHERLRRAFDKIGSVAERRIFGVLDRAMNEEPL